MLNEFEPSYYIFISCRRYIMPNKLTSNHIKLLHIRMLLTIHYAKQIRSSCYIHYITLHYITSHYITLHYITLHYSTVHYIHDIHYIDYIHTSHYITLHYSTLQYITLHFITLQYITLQTLHTGITYITCMSYIT